MVDIIKLEDLTLSDIKSRIVNLDNRFTQGTLTFTDHRETYQSFMTDYETIGFNLFTNMLMQVTGDDDVIEPLIQLKDALLSALSYAQEKNLTELEQGYTEALEAFETINTFMLSQLNSLDIEEFVKREFHVCDVEVNDPVFQKTTNKFDMIRDLGITEVSDPINSKEFLLRPKRLIKELKSLCNKTIVKRLNNQNREFTKRNFFC